jgi:plasmid stabilization system protein ParE
MTRHGLHPEALLDLEEIHDYIAEDSPTAARRVIEEIFSKIELITEFPEMGHLNYDVTSRLTRFLHVRDYLTANVE